MTSNNIVSGLVSLRDITKDNVIHVCKLSNTLSETQRQFVANNATSIACAHYEDVAWIQAVYVDESPAGFIELHERPEIPEYLLWRFMIAGPYQGKGVGRKAIELLIAHVRTLPHATSLETSYIEGEGGPRVFYEGLGFKGSGKSYNGETGLSLSF